MIPILTFFILFTIDNLFAIYQPFSTTFENATFIPYFSLIGLCFYPFFDKKENGFYVATILGLIFDFYATNLIGLYTVLFVMIFYLIKKYIVAVTPINFISLLYVVGLAILFTEIVTFIFVVLFTNISVTMFEFIQTRLMTTLIFNIFNFSLLYLPFTKIFSRIKEKKIKPS